MHAALKGFDLKSGAGKVSAEFLRQPALCNDMAIGPDGAVYVTNTLSPEILRLNPSTRQLEVWYTNPALQPPDKQAGLDGIAFGSDGNLYVDRYTPGDLYRVSVTNGKPTGVATAGRTAWISEGQLSLLFDPTKKGQQPKLPFRLYSVSF